jgi:hypothetical protein
MDYFRYILYGVILPLIFYNSINENNYKIFTCFLVILLSHIYKEFQNNKWKWPSWIEPIGFVIGYVLFNNSKNNIIQFIGILKMLAHIRQFILKDNIYYGIS